jgi:hypothetical protein
LKKNIEKSQTLKTIGISTVLSAAVAGGAILGKVDKKVSAVAFIGSFIASLIAQHLI